ncbi:MAG: hypothetical protein ACM3RQ_00700 [Methanocella sp.]
MPRRRLHPISISLPAATGAALAAAWLSAYLPQNAMLRCLLVARLAVVMTGCVVASACTADDASKVQDRCRSWIATARYVGEEWLNGDIPSRYAIRTLDKAVSKLAEHATCKRSAFSAAALHTAVSRGAPAEVRRALAGVDGVPGREAAP